MGRARLLAQLKHDHDFNSNLGIGRVTALEKRLIDSASDEAQPRSIAHIGRSETVRLLISRSRAAEARAPYFRGRDGSEISATAAPTLPSAAARGSVAMSPKATMPASFLSRSRMARRRT